MLRFELLQEISGVVAVLRRGALTLQLWQSGERAGTTCTIRLDRGANVFQVFAGLAKVARSALVEEWPRLRPWGDGTHSGVVCRRCASLPEHARASARNRVWFTAVVQDSSTP